MEFTSPTARLKPFTFPTIQAFHIPVAALDQLRRTLEKGIRNLTTGLSALYDAEQARAGARSWIQYRIKAAQQAQKAARHVPDGRTRHGRIKAARDEIRRLRKLERMTYR